MRSRGERSGATLAESALGTLGLRICRTHSGGPVTRLSRSKPRPLEEQPQALESGRSPCRGSGGVGEGEGKRAFTQPGLTCGATYACTFPVWMLTGWDVAQAAWWKLFTPCGGGSGSNSSPGGLVNHRPESGFAGSLSQHRTHRDVLKGNVGHVVVGAALPGVVQPEGQGAGVPALQGRELAESAVLDVDGAIIELNSSDWKIPMELGKTGVRLTAMLGHRVVCTLREAGNRAFVGTAFLLPTPATPHIIDSLVH